MATPDHEPDLLRDGVTGGPLGSHAPAARVAFDRSPTATAIVRLDDRMVLDANEAWADLFGSTRARTVGYPLGRRGVGGRRVDAEPLRAALDELGAGRPVDDRPVRVEDPLGKAGHLRLSARTATLRRAACAIVTLVDVSAEREAIDAANAFARYGEAIESVHDFDALVEQALALLVARLRLDFGTFQEVTSSGTIHRAFVGDVPRALRERMRRPLAPGVGTMGQVARTGRAQLVPDHGAFEDAVPEAVAVGIVTTLTLPVKLGRVTRFVMTLGSVGRAVEVDAANVATAHAYVQRLENALTRVEHMHEIEATREATFRALGQALEHRDLETRGHMDRVVALSRAFAAEVDLAPDETLALTWGAYLHDVGKLGLPDAILHKPHGLTLSELDRNHLHTLHGLHMLRDLPFLPVGTRQVVRSHHERWDGRGYPDGLAGEAIPVLARMFAYVDVYDALRSERPYKSPWPHDRAFAEIEAQSGAQFDPALLAPFRRAAGAWRARPGDDAPVPPFALGPT